MHDIKIANLGNLGREENQQQPSRVAPLDGRRGSSEGQRQRIPPPRCAPSETAALPELPRRGELCYRKRAFANVAVSCHSREPGVDRVNILSLI